MALWWWARNITINVIILELFAPVTPEGPWEATWDNFRTLALTSPGFKRRSDCGARHSPPSKLCFGGECRISCIVAKQEDFSNFKWHLTWIIILMIFEISQQQLLSLFFFLLFLNILLYGIDWLWQLKYFQLYKHKHFI